MKYSCLNHFRTKLSIKYLSGSFVVPIEATQHLDLSTRQIRELQSAGVPSKGVTLDEARLAYIHQLREQAAGRVATNGLDLACERARLARLQADKLEAELAAKRGDMITLTEAVMGWSDLVNAFRQKMLSLPVRASDSIPGIADRSAEESETEAEGNDVNA